MACLKKPSCSIGHRDDLHDTGLGQLLHALAHGGLAEPDGLADLRIGAPAVLLELLDDPLETASRATGFGRVTMARFCQPVEAIQAISAIRGLR